MAFPGGDTLSLDRPGPAIALVQVTDELAVRFTSLRRTIRTALGTEVRMIRLPARPEDAERLLDGLAHRRRWRRCPVEGTGPGAGGPPDAAGLAQGTRPAAASAGERPPPPPPRRGPQGWRPGGG